MRRSGRTRRWERGQSLAEFAIILPILVILIFGFIDIARVYNAWTTMQGAAREGARYGVTGRSDCAAAADDRIACIQYTTRQRAKALTNEATDLTVSVRSWDYPSYSGSGTAGSAGTPCDAIEVQVDYEFTPSTPLFGTLVGALHLKSRERLVNEPWGQCS